MHLERLINKYQHSLQLIVGGVLFGVLFNQSQSILKELNNLSGEVSEVKLNQIFPRDDFTSEMLMEHLVSNDKLVNIYTGNLLLGMNQGAEDFLPVNKHIIAQIEQDKKDGVVFKKLANRLASPVGSYKPDSNVVNFFNKWEVQVTGADDFWVTNFPMNPFLAMNSELVPWPKCPAGASPLIASTEAYKIGSQFYGDLIIKEYQKLQSWQVTFDGVDLFDKAVIGNQRALLLISCKKKD